MSPFRTGYQLRLSGFLHVLGLSFEELLEDFKEQFNSDQNKCQSEKHFHNLQNNCKILEAKLSTLINYIDKLNSLRLLEGDVGQFIKKDSLKSTINRLHEYVTDAELLWDIEMVKINQEIVVNLNQRVIKKSTSLILKVIR